MATFTILVSNGYNLEYQTEIEAKSAKEARRIYLERERGTWQADMIKRDPKKMRACKNVARL